MRTTAEILNDKKIWSHLEKLEKIDHYPAPNLSWERAIASQTVVFEFKTKIKDRSLSEKKALLLQEIDRVIPESFRDWEMVLSGAHYETDDDGLEVQGYLLYLSRELAQVQSLLDSERDTLFSRPVPDENIEELLSLNRIMQNGDGTYSPTVSLADVINYFLDCGSTITPAYIGRYFRKPTGEQYTASDKIINREREKRNLIE